MVQPMEIRLLGSLRVRRCDDSAVQAAEWRTGKTVDLLRLLALNVDQPVRVDSLLDKLWPDVAESKGRASLRTAASQLRRTLRSNCIERRMGGLVLTNAWVDVAVFRDLAVEARAYQRSGDHAKVVGLTRQAEAMYLGDFEAHDGDSEWAKVSRESIATLRVTLLTDAVESAVELGWLRDAIDLATLVIEADPYSDRGHRSLMRAYAGLGENDRALRVFADFRSLLDRELGISPSVQAQALQRSLLSGTFDASPVASWTGHEAHRSAVVDVVTGSSASDVRVMCVVGAPGSGRKTVIDAALDQAGIAALHLHPGPTAPLPSNTQIAAAACQTRVVVLPPLDQCEDADVAGLVGGLSALRPVDSARVIIPVDPSHLETLLMELELARLDVDVVELHALSRSELHQLAGAVLCGPVARGLVDTLTTATGGLARRATTELEGWLKEGRILWTPSGLDLAPAHDPTPSPEIDKLIRRILERLCPLGMDIVSLVALIDRPVTASLIVELLDGAVWPDVTEQDVDLALDHLADLGVLRLEPAGYECMHERMRASTEAWLRHGARRRLHRRLAMSPLLPQADRASHWIKAGDPVRAAECELEAARAAHAPVPHRVHESIGDTGVADRATVDVALTHELTSAVTMSVPLAGSLDLTTRAALIEASLLRTLQPLLVGEQLKVTLTVVPDVRASAAMASVACTDSRSMPTVSVQRSA